MTFYIYFDRSRFVLHSDGENLGTFASEDLASDMAIRFAQDTRAPYTIIYDHPGTPAAAGLDL